MQLNDHELQDLATFFARRAPSIEERYLFRKRTRLSVATDQPHHPRTGWLQILVEATDAGRLGRLAYVISAQYPDDRNLQQVCQLLAEKGNSDGLKRAAMYSLPISAFAIVLFFWPHGQEATLQPQSVTIQPQSVEQSAPETTASLQPQSIEQATVGVDKKRQAPPATASSSKPKSVKTPVKAVTTRAPSRQLAMAKQAPDHTPCETKTEQIIGYWYSGDDPAGVRGQTITIPKTVNVRTEYPSFRNDYSPRSPVQCVLFEGEQVKLSLDPILVSGDRYWIPITGKDLIRS
jgi:hypothetical protein